MFEHLAVPTTCSPSCARLNRSVRHRLLCSAFVAQGFLLPALAMAQLAAPPLRYLDFERPFYTIVVNEEVPFAAGTPIIGPDTVESPHRTGRACVTQTDATLVPYAQEEAHILVTTDLGKPVFLRVCRFRILEVRWINERLIYLERDMGHVAGVEELFDVIEGKWLFQKSVEYRWP